MAIIVGGLHGRPAGNVAGVVYGAARTRTGKAVTARELVSPSNPQTVAQQLQRHIFAEALNATRLLGADCWQDSFNRAIGQLPGFQSMMSIILNNTNASEEFTPPADTPLGDLHYPYTLTVVTGAGATKTVTITYTDELGGNGTIADKFGYIVIGKDAGVGYTRYGKFYNGVFDRGDSPYVAGTGVAGTEVVVGLYLIGQGTAEGLLSTVKWYSVTSHV